MCWFAASDGAEYLGCGAGAPSHRNGDGVSPFVPYGRQIIDDQDIAAVSAVLRHELITTGPAVQRFERSFAEFVGATEAVAVSNGTAALHLAVLAAGIGPGDEVIVSALTFAASANCVRYVGADVVFADVLEDTLTLDPGHVASLVTPRTRAIVAVDYAGLPCDLDALLAIAREHDLVVIEDAAHAPGARYRDRPVGAIAHMTTFSFHPVKHLTTGEGGMVTTQEPRFAETLRRLRNHGLDSDPKQRDERGTWTYDMVDLGFNYRLSDINCALGHSQLAKLPVWLERRRRLASCYLSAFSDHPWLRTQGQPGNRLHAWHLFPIRLVGGRASERRQAAFETLREHGVGVNVHYLPVYLLTYYRRLGYPQGLCPVAERAYDGLLSLPMWPGLTDRDQDRIIGLLVEGDWASRG